MTAENAEALGLMKVIINVCMQPFHLQRLFLSPPWERRHFCLLGVQMETLIWRKGPLPGSLPLAETKEIPSSQQPISFRVMRRQNRSET